MEKNKLIKDFSKESLSKYLDESLKKLHTEWIDLYQLHGPSLENLNEELYETLESFKKSGKVKYIGISAGGDVLDKAINSKIFDAVMVSYNIINQQTEPQLRKAKNRGKGTLIKSPLAQTLFSNKIFKIKSLADVWYFLRFLKNHRHKYFKARKCRFINHIDGWTGTEIALKFVLENPFVDVAMIGTTRPEHLLANIHATQKKLDKEIYTLIKERCKK